MVKVTVWYSQNKDGSWEHNHIEDGWVNDFSHPKAISENQKRAWKNKKWKCMFAWLTENKLVSEKAFLFTALKGTMVYNSIPREDFVEHLERNK